MSGNVEHTDGAKAEGWSAADMKNGWKQSFSFENSKQEKTQ
jgi:hypothetical protein